MDFRAAAAWRWDSVVAVADAGASCAGAAAAASNAKASKRPATPPVPETFEHDFIFEDSLRAFSARPFCRRRKRRELDRSTMPPGFARGIEGPRSPAPRKMGTCCLFAGTESQTANRRRRKDNMSLFFQDLFEEVDGARIFRLSEPEERALDDLGIAVTARHPRQRVDPRRVSALREREDRRLLHLGLGIAVGERGEARRGLARGGLAQPEDRLLTHAPRKRRAAREAEQALPWIGCVGDRRGHQRGLRDARVRTLDQPQEEVARGRQLPPRCACSRTMPEPSFSSCTRAGPPSQDQAQSCPSPPFHDRPPYPQ